MRSLWVWEILLIEKIISFMNISLIHKTGCAFVYSRARDRRLAACAAAQRATLETGWDGSAK